jgi:hypothetical protein
MHLIRILLSIFRVRLARYCFRVSTCLALLGKRLAGIRLLTKSRPASSYAAGFSLRSTVRRT